MAKSKGRLLAELLASDGKVKESKSALDISGGKLAPGDIPTLPISKLEHSSISIAGHSTSLGGSVSLNTGDITEHTEYKYYTDARVRSAISASGDISYNSSTGVISFSASDSPVVSVNTKTGSVVLSTTDIAEGTNKYYTDARVSTRADTILNHSNHSNITVTKVGDQLRFSAAAQYGDSNVGSYLSTNGYATQSTIVAAITDSAPGTLDTLNELAAALGDDANFSTTVTNSIATKLPLSGGTMTGNLTLEDSELRVGDTSGDNWTRIKHNQADGYGFDFQHNNATVIVNEQGSTNQVLVLGDVDAANYSGLFGIAHTTDAGSNWTKKLDLRGNGELYIGASGASQVYHQGYHPEADTLTTPRTIAGTSFDGSANIDISYDNLTNKPSNIANSDTVDGLHAASFIRSDATDTASERITFSKGINVGDLSNGGITGNNYNITGVNTLVMNDPGEGIQFSGTSNVHLAAIDDSSDSVMNFANASELRVNNNKVWTVSNDGSGSGLDADLLDGQQGSYYTNASNISSGTLNTNRIPDFVHIGNANGTGYSTDDGSWGSRLNVSSNVHAKIEVSQQANSMRSHWYAHTGQDSIKFGTSSAHDVEFQRNGSTHLEIRSNVVNATNGLSVGSSNHTVWHAGNDGSGSGLDADTVDGVQASRIIYGSNSSGTSEGTFTDWNSINKSGFYSDDGASNKWSTANWSSVLHHKLYSSNNNYATQLGFDTYNNNLYTRTNNAGTWTSWDKIWHAGVDGSGSGLDADLLDGQHGSHYLNYNNLTNKPTIPTVHNGVLYINTSGSISGGGSFTANNSGNVTLTLTGNGIMQGTNAVQNGSFSNAIGEGFRFQRVTGGSNRFYGSHHNVLQIPNTSGDQYLAQLAFGTGDTKLGWRGKSTTFTDWYDIWHSGNDGSGSGLDADLLDGQQPSQSGGANKIAQFASNGYLTVGNWIYSANSTGIYWPSGLHVYESAGNLHINTPGRYYTSATQGRLWGATNDGSGSGLDADTVDGIHGGSFLRSDTADTGSGKITLTAAEGLEVFGIRGRAVGSQTGDFIQMYERVSIGYPSGWGAGGANSAPTQGLTTHGGAMFNTGNVSGAPLTFNGNTIWHAGNDGSGSGLDADTVDGWHASDFTHATASQTWSSIAAASTQAKRYHIARLYGCPAHWDSDWQNIELHVTAESYEAGTLKYKIHGNYGGAGSQANMITMHLTEAYGDMIPRFRIILGSPVDAGWDHSGQDTYYVDVFAEASHYSNWKIHAKTFGHGVLSSNPSSGGAKTVFYSSPTASNISTFSETHTQSTIRLDTSNIQTQKAQTKLKSHSNGWEGGLALISQDGSDTFQIHPDNNGYMYVDKNWYFTGDIHVGSIGQKVWHQGNDGSGSGLDADTLDGQHGSHYLNYNNLTNKPTIPSLSGYATETYVNTQVNGLVDSAPGALNTLNELAAALGDDANFSTTVTNSIATKLPKAGGTVTGDLIVRNGNANAALHFRTSNDFVGIGFNRNVATGAIFDSNINAFQMHIQNNKLEFETYNGSGGNVKDAAWVLDTSGNQSITGTMLVGGQYSNNSYSTVSSTRLLFGGGNDQDNYHIGTNMENYGGNYTKLDLRWHTGIRMGAQPGYGGIRFFNNEDLGSVLFSIGKGDTNMRVEGGNMLFTGDRLAIFGPNTGYSRELAIGGNGNLSTSTRASIGVTNGNLHIDSASAHATYLNFYDGTSGVAFGSGNTSIVAWMGPDGDLWKGSGDNSGSKYWHAGNDGSGSGLDADLLDGYHKQQISRYQSGSDFTNGTLVTTNINSGNTNGDSFVIEISGKAYGSSRPHFVIAEGYIYNNTIINTNGSNIGGSNFTYLKVMNISGNLCFWWPRHGYWNSYDVFVRSSSAGTSNYNRVTAIANSVDPTNATKKIQINLVTGWTASTDGSGSGLDADLLDGVQGANYGRLDQSNVFGAGSHSNYFRRNNTSNYTNAPLLVESYGGSSSTAGVGFHISGSVGKYLYMDSGGNLYWNSSSGKVWRADNDGAGSGLDADLLDGQQGSFYRNASNIDAGTLPIARLPSPLNSSQAHAVTGSAFATTSSPSSVLEYQQASGQTDTKLAPSGDWHNTIRMGHGNPYSYYSSTIAVRMTGTGTGDLYTQNIGNNSANGWRKHWNDANDGSGSGLDADTLDGNHASAFLTTSGTAANSQLLDSLDSTKFTYYRGVASGDWDSIFTTGTGKTQTSGLYQINNTTGGSYSNYPGTIMGITPYSYGGVFAWNLANHTFKLYSTHVGNLFYQSGWNNDEYSGWRMILDSGNYSSAGIWGSANDGSGSGLDADLLDGQHASAFLTSETLSSTNTVTVTGTKYFQPAGSATSPLGGGGGSSLQAYAPNNGTAAYMGFHRSSQYAINWGLDTSNTMVLGGWSSSTTVPRMSIGTNGMMVTAGQGTLWGASNDGAGSGLDADTVDGLQVHTARNNVADRIVRTNIHGYIDTGYINTINNDMTTTLATKVYVSNDNYIRHHDMNSFRSLMNVSANGNYNGREQSTSDQNYWVGSMGWGTTNLNNILHYGSGFWDSWGTPDNRPSTYTTHWTGINMMHYSASNTYHHGGQMAMGAGNPAHTYLRGWWANGGSGYGWQKIWTDGNDGSGSGLDADLLDGQHGSYYARKTYWPDVNTRLGQDAHSLTNLNTQALWSQPSGYQTMVHAGNSNGLPSSHGQSYFGYTITSRRDTGTGYSALLTSYDNSNMYFTYNSDEANYSTWRKLWHDGNDGSGSGLDADLLDGYNSAENGANTIHRLASNGYSQIQNWQNVGNAGIYSTTQNGAHFTPNTATSYGTWKTSGSRGGYDGIVFDSGGDQAIMYDGSGNGGIFKQGHAWIHYYHVGNSCSAFGDSTTSSSYEVYVHGTLYATGNVIAYSDRRIKENVVQIDGALEKVNNLVGVYYNKKDDESKQKEIGFIAQDVKEVVPELVNYAEDTDQYGVKYQNTTALLVEAVKELTQQVNDLKKELEEIKNDK